MDARAWKQLSRVGSRALGPIVTAAAMMSVPACGAWADHLACGDQGCGFTREEWARVRSLADVTANPAVPDLSNRYLPIADWTTGDLTPGAVATPVVQLGWHLYYETRLSGSDSDIDMTGAFAPTSRKLTCGQVGISCATCHDPVNAGSDVSSVPRHVSIGAGWYDVNSQQTLNAARFPVLYWNGRTDTLWAQAAQVMESGVSMNGHRMKTFWVITSLYRAAYDAVGFAAPSAAEIDALRARLGAAGPAFNGASIKAFHDQYASLTPAEQHVVTAVHVNAAKAIAAYEWLLSSDGSPFDRFAREGSDSTALTPAAVRGLKLFIGRASCIDCHATPLFSDGKFHNIGIPQTGDHVPTLETCEDASCDCSEGGVKPSCLPSGAFGGRQKLLDPPAAQLFHRGGEFDDSAVAPTPPDPTLPDPRLLGAWRTPSLRDVALTGPYMHDGSLATLADVVWHYSEGEGTPTLGTSELAPLALAERDRDDLLAFLQSLTGVAGPPELIGPPQDLLAPVTSDACAPAAAQPIGALAPETR